MHVKFSGSLKTHVLLCAYILQNWISHARWITDLSEWCKMEMKIKRKKPKKNLTISNLHYKFTCFSFNTLCLSFCCEWWIFVCWFSGGVFTLLFTCKVNVNVNVYAKSNIYHWKWNGKKSRVEKQIEGDFFSSTLSLLIAVSHWINVGNENGSLYKLWSNEKHRSWNGKEMKKRHSEKKEEKSLNKYLNEKSTALRKPFSWFRCKIHTSYLYDNR